MHWFRIYFKERFIGAIEIHPLQIKLIMHIFGKYSTCVLI